jgi:transcriptional regulator with XRE-family HTH domain
VSAVGQDVPMPESHASRGTRRGRRLLADFGDDIRAARTGSGLSQAAVATAAGLSSSEMSRIEQGGSPWLDIVTASRICAVVGLDLSVRAYPGPNPVRDAAHVRLIAAFRARLGASLIVRTEVPIGRERDLRAWDVTTTDLRATAAAEFETRLTDAQALTRRVTLKCRDSGINIVILVLSDTANNRDAVASARAYLRPLFPLDSSAILRALAAGRVPDAGGILFIRSTAQRAAAARPAGAAANPR